MYRPSFYNLSVVDDNDTLLFNGVSGALVRLPHHLFSEIEPFLGPARTRNAGIGYSSWPRASFERHELSDLANQHFETLLSSGIFIDAEVDERGKLAAQYDVSRSSAPFFVTMTTTLDCNMRCYYCYQKDGALEHMSLETCDQAINWVKKQISERNYPSLHVDWYGGEPMLNQEVIERFSSEMILYCDKLGIPYRGSMICNGTMWPSDAKAFLDRNRLKSVQISIDGPERHHNKRRGIIRSDGGPGRNASFQQVIETVASIIEHTQVYFRINVDPYTGKDCLELLDLCVEKNWLRPDLRFFPYLAIINSMTEHCGFIGKSDRFSKFEAEFDDIQQQFYNKIKEYKGSRSLEVVQYYPNRIKLNCAAVSNNSILFGPSGLMYKCGLDVGDDHRAHDALDKKLLDVQKEMLPADRWDRYDPFKHERCSECQFLPVCMGGCPKAQIENDAEQIAMQSRFWENNFERIIKEYARSASVS